MDPGGSTLLTVAVTPGSGPASTGLAVSADLTAIGGSAAQPFVDDATNGDVTAGDNVFSYLGDGRGSDGAGLEGPAGDDHGRGRGGRAARRSPLAVRTGPSTTLVVSQVYGGGGNAGAPLQNDFVELFNLGLTPVDVSGWSVQYASASGSSWQVTPLSGVIAPGRHYLIAEAAGASCSGAPCGDPLPPPDASGRDRDERHLREDRPGQQHGTRSVGACPVSREPRRPRGLRLGQLLRDEPDADAVEHDRRDRSGGGTIDTNDNAADFSVAAPDP